MKITVLGLIQFMTFIAFLVLAGLFFIVRKDFVFALAVLGLAVIYLIVQSRALLDMSPQEKKRTIIAGLASAWTVIIYMLFFCFVDTPYREIWLYLIWIPFALLLLWLILSGEWKEFLKPLSRFFKFINFALEYYLSKFRQD